jgi:quercetin 2,3-dioxygenase
MNTTSNIKQRVRVLPSSPMHWVGDGFPVRTAFTYQNAGRELSPFLMLDHGGPTRFDATNERRGVGEHPHRGFETVTIVYAGEVDHRDSSGGGGSIGPGDVQWMTAGSGVVHEEFHGTRYAQRGGDFEMVQLWVNLPRAHKMTPPGYQALLSSGIKSVPLDAQGQEVQASVACALVRLIAGDGFGHVGAAKTFTPMQVWDIQMAQAATVQWPAHEGWGVGLLVQSGELTLMGQRIGAGAMAVMSSEGSAVSMTNHGPARVLWLSGEPITEPIVGYGPFVMNSKEEIITAVQDYQACRMGSLAS